MLWKMFGKIYGQSFFLIYKYKYDQEVFSNLLQKNKTLRGRVLKTKSILPSVWSVTDKKDSRISQVDSDISSATMENPK